jgi:hypothetical protein
VILDVLAAGSMTLTSVRVLGRHLTLENHLAVLEKAKGRTRHQIDALVAELAPQPDVPTSIRKLPALTAPSPTLPASLVPIPAGTGQACAAATALTDAPPVLRPVPRPIVQVTAPGRYRFQFTLGQEARDRLRRVQALLRREIPDGDEAAIFDRALKVLEADVEKTRLGTTPSQGVLSVPRRMDTAVTPVARAATSPTGSSGSCGGATVVNAPSFLPTAGGARSGPSWSSTTFSLMRKGDRPAWRTSPCAAGATTNTRPKSSSDLTTLSACVRSAERPPAALRGARIRYPAQRRMSRISAPFVRTRPTLSGPRFARLDPMFETADDLVREGPIDRAASPRDPPGPSRRREAVVHSLRLRRAVPLWRRNRPALRLRLPGGRVRPAPAVAPLPGSWGRPRERT